MDSPVALLLDLQDALTKLRHRREEREKMPPDVELLDQEFREKESTVEELRERVARHEAEKLEVDGRLAEAQDRLKKFQGQLMSVRTNKEYSAALNEIDMGRKEVKELEDRSLALDEALETDCQDLAELEESLPGERAAFEERIADWRSFQAGCDAEISKLEKQVRETESALPKTLASQFRQIYDRRGGVAVVRVTGPSCGGCNVRLRPALYQTLRLRSSREVLVCEGCKRILYFDADASSE